MDEIHGMALTSLKVGGTEKNSLLTLLYVMHILVPTLTLSGWPDDSNYIKQAPIKNHVCGVPIYQYYLKWRNIWGKESWKKEMKNVKEMAIKILTLYS